MKIISLHIGEDEKNKVIKNISENVSFTGGNLWILACAILIASIGLNVNSIAVIIGAMLISPLMGPIVGAGLSLSIMDIDLFKKSIKNLAIATVVSLFVSTVYFALSPFKETQTEILARTSPNIYDILIAFIGGLVGAIAATRVEKGNPVPGVAIATALMPPLCTAGYALSVGNYSFFFGALYLYSINCVFICVATYIILKILKYPIVNVEHLKHHQRVKYSIYLLILIMIVPSVYFAYQLFNEKQFNQKVENFITSEISSKGKILVFKRINYKSSPRLIEVALLNNTINQNDIELFNIRLEEIGLSNTKLVIINEKSDDINKTTNMINSQDLKLKKIESELNSLKIDNLKIKSEILQLFPLIDSYSIAIHNFDKDLNNKSSFPILLYNSTIELNNEEKNKMTNWLKVKLEVDSILVKKI